MSERVEIEYLLTINIEDAITNTRQLERSLIRLMGYAQRLTGS